MEGATDRTTSDHAGQSRGHQEEGPLEQTLPSTLQLHLDKVLEAIKASREVLEQKIETVVRR